jgi:hypothetical protein
MGKQAVLTFLTVAPVEVKIAMFGPCIGAPESIFSSTFTSSPMVTWHGITWNAQILEMLLYADDFRKWSLKSSSCANQGRWSLKFKKTVAWIKLRQPKV